MILLLFFLTINIETDTRIYNTDIDYEQILTHCYTVHEQSACVRLLYIAGPHLSMTRCV